MRGWPGGPRRSVDRGARRPAIEPRKFLILGADTVHMVEGNILGRVSASAWTTRRGQRPWHVPDAPCAGVESPGGVSPPGAPRTVHEPLDSHGSRCSAV